MTRVSQVHLVVQDDLELLVYLIRVKGCRENLAFLGKQDFQASLDKKENLELWDSPALWEQKAIMAFQVYLEGLEKLVGLVPKDSLEKLLVILEHQDLKADKEIQGSQATKGNLVNLAIMDFQEIQVSSDRRGLLVNRDGME